MLTNEIIQTVAPYVTAVAGLLGGMYAASKSNSNQLTAAYFTHMVEAYEHFWNCFNHFVYSPSEETRNQFSVAVYNAVLYASADSASGIQILFYKAIDYTQEEICLEELDEWAGRLEQLLHHEVLTFRTRAR